MIIRFSLRFSLINQIVFQLGAVLASGQLTLVYFLIVFKAQRLYGYAQQ